MDARLVSTASVLEAMTAAVVQRKVEAGARLTPVGIEGIVLAPTALPHTAAPFPHDVPDEAILGNLSIIEEELTKLAKLDEAMEESWRVIRLQYGAMRASVDAVKAQLGSGPAAPAPADLQREKERAADARIAAAAIEAALIAGAGLPNEDDEPSAPEQVTTVSPPDAPAVAAVLANMDQKAAEAQAATFVPVDAGWHCPEHTTFITKTSRLGRAYRVCPVDGCKAFEKL